MMELQSDLDQCLPPGTEAQAPNDDIQITDCERPGTVQCRQLNFGAINLDTEFCGMRTNHKQKKFSLKATCFPLASRGASQTIFKTRKNGSRKAKKSTHPEQFINGILSSN
ncbi:hypothetical protein AWZ03_006257 [Drosophila navojoa]|uniref:Uncharacterized protein n=1 Tax=Drosophila navojoa TaxID=7232 RepID=A0A484BEZ9_DRONA|nr:hypothetical protein AWZ03_006257 [Drosophila navojoa]